MSINGGDTYVVWFIGFSVGGIDCYTFKLGGEDMVIKKKDDKKYVRDDIKMVKRFAFIPTCVCNKKGKYVWVWFEAYNKELKCLGFDRGIGFYLWNCIDKYRLK